MNCVNSFVIVERVHPLLLLAYEQCRAISNINTHDEDYFSHICHLPRDQKQWGKSEELQKEFKSGSSLRQHNRELCLYVY